MGDIGMLISMLIGYALAFIGIGLFVEGWREFYRVRQENRDRRALWPRQAPAV